MADGYGVRPPHNAGGVQSVDADTPDTAPMIGPAELAELVERLQAKRTVLVEDPPVRSDLVNRIKAEIDAGTYETPERIDATVDRLMDELFFDL